MENKCNYTGSKIKMILLPTNTLAANNLIKHMLQKPAPEKIQAQIKRGSVKVFKP